MTQNASALECLRWHIDAGADAAFAEAPADWTGFKKPQARQTPGAVPVQMAAKASLPPVAAPQPPLLGASDARKESENLARGAQNLEELKQAIAAFDGIAIKNTATNLVFSSGNPAAKIMLVGEAPGADEDRQGEPFVGASGQLLDKILDCVGLSRHGEDPLNSVYISNILNWRPPGNRTPAPGEIEVSLPFIERHIALVQPDILMFVGGVSAKALLNRTDSISRLRQVWHGYAPVTPDIGLNGGVAALATYHPAFLLRTPGQKRAVWTDMLMLQKKRMELGLIKEEETS